MKLAPSLAAGLGLLAIVAPRSASAYGEPVDGYPTHDERLILVTINRVRANPDDQAAGNAAACSTPHPPVPPVAYDAKLGHASRFHCKHLSINDGGLSHQTFCTLDPQIATNGCDGAAACSCMAGTECWNCDTLGGCGSGPNDRAAIFGFAGGVAEVGAAGYGPAGASTGWSTECPPNEPHRDTLTNGGLNVVGTGYATGGGCWGDFEFADFGTVGDVVTPRIASAIDNAGTIEANWYDPGGDPLTIDAVVDGVCTPMTIAVGIDAGNRDYRAPFQPSGACQQWYVVARAPGGEVVRYPDAGSLTVGCPDEYVPTQMDATCAACNDGETRDCTQGDCAGTQACEAGAWGACDAPATCGSGGGGVGAGGTSGGGTSGGGALGADAAGDESDGGCGCRVGAGAGGAHDDGAWWLAGVVAAGALTSTRRRRRPR